MTDRRDTKFQGFAELVAQELREQDLLFIGNHIKPLVEPPIDVDYENIKRIIAQRAYDLANHVLRQTDLMSWDAYSKSPLELLDDIDIPDLIQWPEYHEPRLFEPDTWSFNQPTEPER